jgi:hypothetical protein
MSPASFIDWFIPESLRHDTETLEGARMFVQRHFAGPLLGLVLVAYLYAIDPSPSPHVRIIFAGVLLLYACPLLLRLAGQLLLLSLLSMELVVLLIFFSA